MRETSIEAVATSTISFVTAGLLASSCCLIQVMLNILSTFGVLHAGCAGFNKVLGPHRTVLRWLTGAWLTLVWIFHMYRRVGRTQWRSLIIRTTITIWVMFLPEILRLAMAPSSLTQIGTTKISLVVSGMGCEACETAVKSILDTTDGVMESFVSFEENSAQLLIGDGAPLNMSDIIQRLATVGYNASVSTCDGAAKFFNSSLPNLHL
eukprot:m.75235 g.75235  ORF g.75235 m.75235 type:complete len:208 (+) comp24757_c0_seq1:433-1056(+)